VIHVPEVRELVHHGVDQGRVLEGATGAGMDQPHPDAAIVEADAIAVVRIRPIGIELEGRQPEPFGHTPRVPSQALDQIRVVRKLEATLARPRAREGERQLRVSAARH
jgi:hypothetical protein